MTTHLLGHLALQLAQALFCCAGLLLCSPPCRLLLLISSARARAGLALHCAFHSTPNKSTSFHGDCAQVWRADAQHVQVDTVKKRVVKTRRASLRQRVGAHRGPQGGFNLLPLAALLLDGRLHTVRLRLRRRALRLQLRFNLLLQCLRTRSSLATARLVTNFINQQRLIASCGVDLSMCHDGTGVHLSARRLPVASQCIRQELAGRNPGSPCAPGRAALSATAGRLRRRPPPRRAPRRARPAAAPSRSPPAPPSSPPTLPRAAAPPPPSPCARGPSELWPHIVHDHEISTTCA